MSKPAQALYLQLVMNADDDGFVGAPRNIYLGSGSSRKYLKKLIEKGYILQFPNETADGIVAVTDWRRMNQIRADRRRPTIYQEEFGKVYQGKNMRYSFDKPEPIGCQDGADLSAECSIEKKSTDQASEGECESTGIHAAGSADKTADPVPAKPPDPRIEGDDTHCSLRNPGNEKTETLSEDDYRQLCEIYGRETVDATIRRIQEKPYYGCLNVGTIARWAGEKKKAVGTGFARAGYFWSGELRQNYDFDKLEKELIEN